MLLNVFLMTCNQLISIVLDHLGHVRIMFLDFSSAFNSIQLLILGEKLKGMGIDLLFVSWTTDYLTERPQFVRLEICILVNF